MLWAPKQENNKMYEGKQVRVLYNKHREDGAYREGKLIFISKCLTADIYSVLLDCNDIVYDYPIKTTITSELIDKVFVKMFDVNESINDICDKYANNDIGHILKEYANPYLEI